MWPPWWAAVSVSVPVSSLPAAAAFVRHFQAVIDGVAHQVHERVDDLLDHRLVQFRGFALRREPHLLAQPARRGRAPCAAGG
jgi:hypothetical protein